MITAYFDTNVYDHIFKRGEGITADDIVFLEKGIKKGLIRLSYSIFNLEEILMQPDSKQTKEEMALLKRLVSPYCFIKIPFELIKGCLSDNVNELELSCYIDDPQLLLNVQDYINNACLNDEVRKETQTQKDTFTRNMKIAKELTLAETKPEDKKKCGFKEFEEGAEKLLRDSLNDFNIDKTILEKLDYQSLLKKKIIRVWIYSSLATMYKQVVKNSEPRSGDSRDLLHCITASTADIFVTHDDNLRKRLELFAADNFKVFNFKEFIQNIKTTKR